MCYTYQTIVWAFSIGLVASFLLYLQQSREKKALGFFFAFVILMQAFDAIFWKYPQGHVNRMATKIAMVFNHLQPIVLAFAIMLYQNRLTAFSKYMVVCYSVMVFVYTITMWKAVDETRVTSKSAPSLYWEWNHGKGATVVYAFFLATLLVLMVQNLPTCGIVAALLTALSFFFSFFKYRIKDSTGRFWCYFAAFAPIVMLIV